MKAFGLQEVAQDIIHIWGDDAERISSLKVEAAEAEGDQVQAAGWRRIRHAIRSNKGGALARNDGAEDDYLVHSAT